MMISENATLEELQQVFSQDRFATEATGCTVVEGSYGHAVCELVLAEHHRNGVGNVMGGAIFTLCDFTLGVACNIGTEITITSEATINFMRTTKGAKLTAAANCDKRGKHLDFYTVIVEDDLEKQIAEMTATCYH